MKALEISLTLTIKVPTDSTREQQCEAMREALDSWRAEYKIYRYWETKEIEVEEEPEL
jgi:hypothetical protein